MQFLLLSFQLFVVHNSYNVLLIVLIPNFYCNIYRGGGGGCVITKTNSNEHPRLDSDAESRLKSNLVSASKFSTVCHSQQLQCSNHPVSSQFKFQRSTRGMI